MARSRDLKIVIAGDADKLDREIRRANGSLDKLGKQTRLTASVSSRGYSAMKVGATGAAAAIGGLVIAGKKVVDAAIESEKSQAKLAAQLKASGLSYRAHAAEIDRVIQKTSQLAGLDDEDLQDAFTAIVRTTGSVNVAMKDMAVVADLARAKNMDVAKAGELVAKIHAGNIGPLKRLGIEFDKNTTSVDRLKESKRKYTKDELDAAKAADKQADSQRALGVLQDRLKGQAEAYGKTTAGSVDRANVAFENLEETIGAALAPTVEDAATEVADFVNEMQDGTGQGGRFVRKLKDVWEETRPVVQWFGRAAKSIANFTAEHPGVAKLAAAVIGVGVAVKALKFVSAATGFSTLLKVGTSASRLLRRRLAANAAAGGAEAATDAAAGFAGQSKKFGAAGRTVGRAFGRGLALGAAAGLAKLGADIADKLVNAVKKRFGDTIGQVLDTVLPGGGLGAAARKALRAVVPGSQAGGLIPGQGRGDIVPAMLEPGEFVMRRAVVERFGPTFFAAVNQGETPQFRASGGVIGPQTVTRMQSAARGWVGLPYVYGGGHGSFAPSGGGFDCSGFVSAVLGTGGSISSPMAVRQPLASALDRGPGKYVTVGIRGSSGRNAHTMIKVGNRYFEAASRGVVESSGWRGSFEMFHPRNEATSGGRAEDPGDGGASGPSKAEIAERRKERAERAGSRVVNRITATFARGIRSATGVAARLGTAIEDQGTAYGQTERVFGMTDEDLGTPGGKARRLNELKALATLKAKTLSDQRKRASALRIAIARLDRELKALRAARNRAKGAKRAKINERIKPIVERRDDLAAEAKSLGEEITATTLDIADLTAEAGKVVGTEDTSVSAAVSATQEKIAQAVSDIDLMERAGLITPDQANQMRVATLQAASTGRFGALDQRGLLEVLAQLGDASKAQATTAAEQTTAVNDLAASLDSATKAIREQNAIASTRLAIGLREAEMALTNVLNNQLGHRVNTRAFNPGDGSLARL